MKNTHIYELFLLKCAPIRAELDAALQQADPTAAQQLSRKDIDDSLKDYLVQIDIDLRVRAARMSEYYRIFYMLENFIREFVDSVLSEAHGDDWWETKVPDAIRDGAKRSKDRELSAGVTPRSDDPIVYTTFGELMGIMSANWDQFGGIFPSSKGVESVMARLNTLRGPIMHCAELAEDEVLRLKLSIRDWFNLFT
jgi:hypothetical protein